MGFRRDDRDHEQSAEPVGIIERSDLNMGKVYVIGAAKGGTAKTVSTYNLAYSLKEHGNSVLLVDMDPQANLTV